MQEITMCYTRFLKILTATVINLRTILFFAGIHENHYANSINSRASTCVLLSQAIVLVSMVCWYLVLVLY